MSAPVEDLKRCLNRMLHEQAIQRVLAEVQVECMRQYDRYGEENETNVDGTGPDVVWVPALSGGTSAEVTETVFRMEYELQGKPTWMHLVREEVAESFKESDAGPLTDELKQVAALCVSWVKHKRTHP